MKRLIAFGVTAAVAAIPAVFGLAGNASFAQTVPVRVPAHAQLVDDKGGQTRHVEPGDDKGGQAPQVEPGDDKGGQTRHVEPGDDNGGSSGGHGGDDVSGDDSGGSSGGHGGDDGSGHQ